MKKDKSINFLVESGIMLALATALSFIKIYQSLYGGVVTPGSMIPIMIIALRWGFARGLLVGGVFGIIQSIVDPFIVHPLQFLLDYPIAYSMIGIVGLGGYFRKKLSIKDNKFVEYGPIIFAIVLAILGRFIFHVISGVVFFAYFAEDMNPFLYSMLYNVSYLGPELIISISVFVLLWNPLKRINIWNR